MMDSDDVATSEDDPEDILSASLQSLYGFSPITFSTAGSTFSYPIHPSRVSVGRRDPPAPEQIEVATPDTDPSNWSLHASSIWVSSLFIANHIEELQIDAMVGEATTTGSGSGGGDLDGATPVVVHVLELGAGAGLPSILLAHMYQHVLVTASDYPDDRLIHVLSDNIRHNGVSEWCHAVAHAWGTDVEPLVRTVHPGHSHDREARFDIIFAADTLWNSELHAPFLDTLCMCLKCGPGSRIHLVAGLHTGRYTIQSFLNNTKRRGLAVIAATEREVGGAQSRPWDVSRAEREDEQERRKWVVWMVLKWDD